MNRKWIVPRCRDFNRSSRQSRIYVAGGCDVISCLTSMMRGHLKSEELYFIFCYELNEQLQLKWGSFVSKSRLFNLWWKIYDIKRQRQQNILDQTLWNNSNVITNRDLLSLTFEMRSLTRRCSDWCSAHSALLAPATSSAPCPPRRPANGAASSCGRPSPAPTAWPSCLHQPGRCELQRCHGYIADCAGTPSGSPHKGQRSSHEADRQTDIRTDRTNQSWGHLCCHGDDAPLRYVARRLEAGIILGWAGNRIEAQIRQESPFELLKHLIFNVLLIQNDCVSIHCDSMM